MSRIEPTQGWWLGPKGKFLRGAVVVAIAQILPNPWLRALQTLLGLLLMGMAMYLVAEKRSRHDDPR